MLEEMRPRPSNSALAGIGAREADRAAHDHKRLRGVADIASVTIMTNAS
jgi:hypothetical protein